MNNILLCSHYTSTQGMVQKFYNALINDYNVILLLHPLYPTSDIKSKAIYRKKQSSLKIPAFIQFPLEGVVSLLLLHKVKSSKSVDLAICFDPLSFLHTFFLKNFLRFKKIIYYNLDYSPHRYANPLMNYIYQKVNKFSYKNSDYFFCPTKQFTTEVDPKNLYTHKAIVLPHVVNIKEIDMKTKKKGDNFIVFAGNMGHTVDFSNVLHAIAELKKDGVPIYLDIYGFGKKQKSIQELVERLNLEKHVAFKGLIDNKTLVKSVLPMYSVGIAPYIMKRDKNTPDHMFLGTDLTSKHVEYIAAGLPIVSTSLYPALSVIEKKKFGYLASDVNDWYRALKTLTTKKKTREDYRRNARNYAKEYDQDTVLKPILKMILSRK